MDTKKISISDYSYDLPDERIAKFPVSPRDHSRLLVYDQGNIYDDHFYNLASYLPEGALMVFNNTRVIHARLQFRKLGHYEGSKWREGALIEVFLLEPYLPADYEQMFLTRGRCTWLCLVGNLKKWKEGPLFMTLHLDNLDIQITATHLGTQATSQIVELSWSYTDKDATNDDGSLHSLPTFAEVLEGAGQLPIPPYLNRDTQPSDLTTYQTVYSKIKGSVAAPTAGLHFTPEVLQSLALCHIDEEELTLHVGAGTFKPVKSKEMGGHEMHTEHIFVRRQTLEKLLSHQCEAIAVGTTSVRTLESLYYMGLKVMGNDKLNPSELHVTQWEPYELPSFTQYPQRQEVCDAIRALLSWLDANQLSALHASTQIIIAPGYEFKIVKQLITNFHQPQSTLLLLVSAFTKGRWQAIYEHALANGYRFLSYGDSSLLKV